MDFAGLVEHLESNQIHWVNAKAWKQHWADRWVTYVDLIGFSSISSKSADTTTNAIVRFDRIVKSLRAAHRSRATVYQFTDAAFVITKTLASALAFACDAQHQCLAVNQIQLTRRPHVLFHHLIAPRITIGFGEVLEVEGSLPPTPMYAGIDPDQFLAGDGIVNAHGLEKMSAGTLITTVDDHIQHLTRVSLAGSQAAVRKTYERWLADSTYMRHQGVVDIPWAIFKPDLSSGVLELDDIASIKQKVKTLKRVWDLSMGEFVTQRNPIDTIKHYGTATRHLTQLVQGLRGHQTNKPWSQSRLAAVIDDM